jgi:hypothetical protein
VSLGVAVPPLACSAVSPLALIHLAQVRLANRKGVVGVRRPAGLPLHDTPGPTAAAPT